MRLTTRTEAGVNLVQATTGMEALYQSMQISIDDMAAIMVALKRLADYEDAEYGAEKQYAYRAVGKRYIEEETVIYSTQKMTKKQVLAAAAERDDGIAWDNVEEVTEEASEK